jgi:hypothetical protein
MGRDYLRNFSAFNGKAAVLVFDRIGAHLSSSPRAAHHFHACQRLSTGAIPRPALTWFDLHGLHGRCTAAKHERGLRTPLWQPCPSELRMERAEIGSDPGGDLMRCAHTR